MPCLSPQDAVLVRSPNWLGDAVIALPFLARLRSFLTESRIGILTPGKLKAFWDLVPGISAVHTTDNNPFISADAIRSSHYDTALVLPNSTRTALEVFLARIPKRYGFTGRWRQTMLTDSWPRTGLKDGWRHQALELHDLLDQLGLPGAASLSFTPLPRPVRPTEAPASYLAVCPGAEYGPAKRWMPERYAKAAQVLAENRGWEIVLLGAEGDRAAADAVAAALPAPCRNLCGTTSLASFISWTAHATHVLCNDSGSMHLAAAFGTPATAIFGSTEERLTGPLSEAVRVVRHHVPCSPCFLRECPIDFRCMNGVTVDDVLSAIPAAK